MSKSSKSNTIKKRIEQKKKLFLEAYKNKACNISMSCEAVGINRDTYYEWRKKDKEFDKKCAEIEAGLIDLAETQLLKNIRDGKETSLIFFLVNKAKDKWQSVNKVEHSVSGETSQKIDEVLDMFAKILKGSKDGKG